MTRPRGCGATIWMNEVSGKMNMPKITATSIVPALDLPKVELTPAFTEALASLSKTKAISEVNDRPTRQQCPVCTP